MFQTFLKLSRPASMTKNLFVLAPLFFSGHLLQVSALKDTLAMFAAFCLLTAGIYAFNDVVDADADLRHPAKKNRPIPSGRISRAQALVFAMVTMASGATIAGGMAINLLFVCFVYVVIQILYSCWLKNTPYADLICISMGFLMRIVAGGMAAHVPVSPWLLTTGTALAFYMGTGKRLTELNAAADPARHRLVLKYYGEIRLRQMLFFSGVTTLFIYIAYVMLSSTTMADRSIMAYTIFPVLLAMVRFGFLVLRKRIAGEFVSSILMDPVLALLMLCWMGIFFMAIYL